MASPNLDISVGFTLTLPNSNLTMQVVDVTPPEISVESINTSHQGTSNWHTFEPSELRDGGRLSVEVHVNPDQDPETLVGVKETAIVLTWPSTATWTFAGHVESYAPGSMALDQKMTGTVNIKVSGDISVAVGTGG